mmetsp:Transcript_13794/g.48076  ORF Transcript_13794/g.48076 Transcript_13794/m.48076 type:complete len:213 (+) Transcript_13794:114-752(+)
MWLTTGLPPCGVLMALRQPPTATWSLARRTRGWVTPTEAARSPQPVSTRADSRCLSALAARQALQRRPQHLTTRTSRRWMPRWRRWRRWWFRSRRWRPSVSTPTRSTRRHSRKYGPCSRKKRRTTHSRCRTTPRSAACARASASPATTALGLAKCRLPWRRPHWRRWRRRRSPTARPHRAPSCSTPVSPAAAGTWCILVRTPTQTPPSTRVL